MKTAIILPCYNEEVAIVQVIQDFQKQLPHATIYVIDNNSSDKTAELSHHAGAQVIFEKNKGKGNAVRRAFAEIESDIYVMADGDGTYESSAVNKMIDHLLKDQLDMVVGIRMSQGQSAYRIGHQFGNKLFNSIVRNIFGNGFKDIFSGYRVMSRRFVKTFPAISKEFEIETELSVHSLQLRLPTQEIETKYGARPEGSHSKLNTYTDACKILLKIIQFTRIHRPLFFYGSFSLLLSIVSIILGIPIIIDFLQTGLVPRLPTAVLASGLMIISFIFLVCGLILDAVKEAAGENKRLKYLEHKALNIHIE
ncbi:glycosyltransferase [Lentisphaera marina]|uniref:glycosyltransferase n=1 Tax=Lentisphaera marina TaxID=1111041 RepID=UPI00236627C1|nr:glycosyltransferase [Lentisphaera marina]MDD7985749.1 glycosyltransferase [Lentisphaera marina]